MILFLCIDIQFFSISLWQDLLTGTIGAFLGFLGAYFIFIRGIKNDRKKERQRFKDEQLDKLKYFSILTENIIKISKKQSENYILYVNKIKLKPFEHHLLGNITNNDIKRATNKLNLEEYYLAYISRFGNDKNTIKEYKDIISSFDYIDTIYDEAVRILKEKLEKIYQMKVNLNSAFVKVCDACGQTIYIENVKDQEEVLEFFNTTFKIFFECKTVSDGFITQKEKFIEPIMQFLIEKNYLGIPYLNKIFFQLKECTIIYDDIIFDVNDLCEAFRVFADQMKDANNTLIESSKRLIKIEF
ncbi:MAG: hypothetical protein IPJ81_07205 [Chitinophagaceae bacterium]|nr:hypothetical protein [Chitinophagaceae bacterium]